jgi:LytS/YehU family sensor histidine kinase
MWALVVTMIMTVHGAAFAPTALLALRMILAAAVLGLVVQRLTERFPWPRQVTVAFVGGHLAAAAVYSVGWVLLNDAIETAIRGRIVVVIGIGLGPFVVTGVWFYVMIAGVSYTAQATERAARAEAAAALSQLAAIRSQLNPHFLFNALHTVMQLIPREPRRAAQAAEELAVVLRTSVEEDRDLVTVAEELAFVEKYLELERLRFGDRLRVVVDVGDAARRAIVPSFAVQTLVENAVRHGASPRVEPTDLTITGGIAGATLQLSVHDNGAGATAEAVETKGTGLKRLRERLAALYGKHARLDVASSKGAAGFTAILLIPQESGD